MLPRTMLRFYDLPFPQHRLTKKGQFVMSAKLCRRRKANLLSLLGHGRNDLNVHHWSMGNTAAAWRNYACGSVTCTVIFGLRPPLANLLLPQQAELVTMISKAG
eukprot:TRINITY_DN86486_c0_g1_i1.p1 TRINITY_DN86486_c0_g1~~TRINITY_DN86486_c0_g1_i1.p1  ORF type:complete len:104 (-),score=11.98 TRINITY_DN86486_c0_g1_i1:10-321(-)